MHTYIIIDWGTSTACNALIYLAQKVKCSSSEKSYNFRVIK